MIEKIGTAPVVVSSEKALERYRDKVDFKLGLTRQTGALSPRWVHA